MQRVWKKRLFAILVSGVALVAILFFFALPLYERYLADQIRLSLSQLPYPVTIGDVSVSFSQKTLHLTDLAVTAEVPDGSTLRIVVGGGTIEGIGAGLLIDAEGVISVLESASFTDISFVMELPFLATAAMPVPEADPAIDNDAKSQKENTDSFGGSLSLTVGSLAFRNLSGDVSALTALENPDRVRLLPVLNSFTLEGLEIGALTLQEELPPPYTDHENGSIISLLIESGSVAQLTLMQAEGVRLAHMKHTQQGKVLSSFSEITLGRLHYPGIFGQLPLPVTSVEDLSVVSLWFQAGEGVDAVVSCNKLTISLGIPFGRLSVKGSVEGLDIPASMTKDWLGVRLVGQNTSERLTLNGEIDATATLPITTPASSVMLKSLHLQIDDLVEMSITASATIERPHSLLAGTAPVLLEQVSAHVINKGLVALHDVADLATEKNHTDAEPVTRGLEGYTAPAIRQLTRDIDCFFTPENTLTLVMKPKKSVNLLAAFMYEESEPGFLQMESVCGPSLP